MTFLLLLARILHVIFVALRATAGILVIGHGIKKFVQIH